jgi:phosphate transport system permease protein
MTSLLFLLIATLALAGFALGRRRVLASARGGIGERVARPHSLPGYYGWYVALWSGLPGLAVALAWLAFSSPTLDRLTLFGVMGDAPRRGSAEQALFMNDVRNVAYGRAESSDAAVLAAARRFVALRERGVVATTAAALVASLVGAALALRRVAPDFAARVAIEGVVRRALMGSSALAVLVTAGIVFSLIFETARFFAKISPVAFLFGLEWSPQTAIRADQVGSSGAFGAVPIFAGTLMITVIAMLVAVPIGLLSAIHMTFYASPRFRNVAKPALEMLAGVPTVVYGFFAALMVAPVIRSAGEAMGLSVASESALAAGLVMGVMIIPFISSLADDAISAVPLSLRDGSYGLGATRSETIRHVIVPAALPGIAGGVLLAVSRAIGETMIVVMAAGLAANLTANPLEAVTTVTVQIVALLTGDQEFDSAKTLSAFALGLVLFAATLLLNVVALRIVQRYREKYD